MSIRMIRQPGDTPNINNIDDIIPFRYAYGNQDGYVINRGNELSYTINGNEFKINSGRVVVQGAESEIDANGATVIVDASNSTKQYYTIYYKVNLATNVVSIESKYDIAGYPTIDKGDDLTKTTSGYATLELYHFEAQSGVISNVDKLVKAIKYTKDITVENSKNSILKKDGTFLGFSLDETGILKIGDIIIPQKRIIYNEPITIYGDISSNEYPHTIQLKDTIKNGDKIRITYGMGVNVINHKDFIISDSWTSETFQYLEISTSAISTTGLSHVWFYSYVFYGLFNGSSSIQITKGASHSITLPFANGQNVTTNGTGMFKSISIIEIAKVIE